MSSRTDEPPVLPLVPRPVASCSVRFLNCSRHEPVHTKPQTTQAGPKSTCRDRTSKAAQPARFVCHSHNAIYHFSYFGLRRVDERRDTRENGFDQCALQYAGCKRHELQFRKRRARLEKLANFYAHE